MVAACVTNTCAMYNSLFEFYGDATVNQNFGSFMHVPNTNFNYNPKYLANCHLISEIPMTVANNNRYFDAIDYENFNAAGAQVQGASVKDTLDKLVLFV